MAQFRHNKGSQTSPYILVHPSLAAHYILEGRRLVVLIRHGQTDWNIIKRLQGRQDIPLNDNGMLQAENVSIVIAAMCQMGVNFGEIFTSPLSRAVSTAQIITEAAGLGAPKIIENLNEREYGCLSGLTLEERHKLYPGSDRQVSGVETVPHSASRMLQSIDEMCDAASGRSVIAVTHGGMINAAYSRLTSGEIGTGKTLTVNCSISMIAAGIGEPIPLVYNLQNESTAHYMRKLISCGADI